MASAWSLGPHLVLTIPLQQNTISFSLLLRFLTKNTKTFEYYLVFLFSRGRSPRDLTSRPSPSTKHDVFFSPFEFFDGKHKTFEYYIVFSSLRGRSPMCSLPAVRCDCCVVLQCLVTLCALAAARSSRSSGLFLCGAGTRTCDLEVTGLASYHSSIRSDI